MAYRTNDGALVLKPICSSSLVAPQRMVQAERLTDALAASADRNYVLIGCNGGAHS